MFSSKISRSLPATVECHIWNKSTSAARTSATLSSPTCCVTHLCSDREELEDVVLEWREEGLRLSGREETCAVDAAERKIQANLLNDKEKKKGFLGIVHNLMFPYAASYNTSA